MALIRGKNLPRPDRSCRFCQSELGWSSKTRFWLPSESHSSADPDPLTCTEIRTIPSATAHRLARPGATRLAIGCRTTRPQRPERSSSGSRKYPYGDNFTRFWGAESRLCPKRELTLAGHYGLSGIWTAVQRGSPFFRANPIPDYSSSLSVLVESFIPRLNSFKLRPISRISVGNRLLPNSNNATTATIRTCCHPIPIGNSRPPANNLKLMRPRVRPPSLSIILKEVALLSNHPASNGPI